MPNNTVAPQNDEFNQFRSALGSQAGNPDTKFVQELKTKSLRTYLGKGWFMSHLWRNIAVGALALSVLGVLAVVVINRNLLKPQPQLTAQSKDVLTKVFSNNPQSLLALKNQAPTSDLQAVRTQASAPEVGNAGGSSTTPTPTDLAPEYIRAKNFNYSYSKSEIKSGPSLTKCQAYALGQEGVVEVYVFFNDKNTQSKTISYDSDKNLTDYYLYGNNYAITYKGGKYAVKTIYPNSGIRAVDNVSSPEPTTAPSDAGNSGSGVASSVGTTIDPNSISSSSSSTPKTDDSVALNFFGENAEVSEKKTENGQDYYEITWTTNVNCDLNSLIEPATAVSSDKPTSAPATANTTKIVNRVRVDANTYNVFREERYFTAISAANLMQTSQNETKTQQVEYSTVQKNFNFEFSVPVKEVTIKYSGYEPTDVTKSLASQDLAVLVPVSTDASLSSVSLPAQAEQDSVAAFSYITDRDFYPAGARGDSLYQTASSYKQKFQESQRVIPQVTANYYFGQGKTFINLNMYGLNADKAAITKSYIPTEAKEVTGYSVKIAGKAVNWKAYEYTSSGGQSVPPAKPVSGSGGQGVSGNAGTGSASSAISVAEPSSTPEDRANFKTIYLVGEYYKNFYVVVMSGDSAKAEFNVLVTSKASDMQTLSTMISKSGTLPPTMKQSMPAEDQGSSAPGMSN
jgi:hypothetical protein